MGVLLTSTAGLCLWIVLWSLGISGFDSFIVTSFMVIVAVAVSTALSGLRGRGD